MDRARQTWELCQQLLEADPDLDRAVLAMAHLGAAITLFRTCDPELTEALLAVLETHLGSHMPT